MELTDRQKESANSETQFSFVQSGAASGSTDLLPTTSASTNWTASLLTDSGRDSDLIYRFDGRQAANVPASVVPQNLSDQFTVATWMKHGPSPGPQAQKETLLCNSDKTGEPAPPVVSLASLAELRTTLKEMWVLDDGVFKRHRFKDGDGTIPEL